MTLGAVTCLNLGAASYLCDTLMPYVLYLGKESDEAALNALRGFEEYLNADGPLVDGGRVVEFEVKERPLGLGAPSDRSEAEKLKAAGRSDRSSSGGTMKIRMLVKVIGRFDLKAKMLAAGCSSFTALVAGGGRIPASIELNNSSEVVFIWEAPSDFDASAPFVREYLDHEGVHCRVVHLLSNEQVMEQFEDSERYADEKGVKDKKTGTMRKPNEEERKLYAYQRNHAFYRRDGQAKGHRPELLSIQPWVDVLHCEINTASWVIVGYFKYARQLGDVAQMNVETDSSHPAHLFIGALQSVQRFKQMATRFANQIDPNPPEHAETDVRPSGGHAVVLHSILPPIRQALLGPTSKAPVESDSQKLERVVIEFVLIAERHLFVHFRKSTIKKSDIQGIMNAARAVRRVLVGTGHNMTYNLFYTFTVLPSLLEFIDEVLPHSDPELIYGIGFLTSTQVHERLNQWAKLKKKYSSGREGWPEELLGNLAIGSIIAFLHTNKYRLHDPSPPERRYYDDFDAEMDKEGQPKECRCCTCVLSDFDGPVEVPAVAASYLGSIFQLREPLCCHCVSVLEIVSDLDRPNGEALEQSWVGRVQKEVREKRHAAGSAVAMDMAVENENWPARIAAHEATSPETYLRATDAQSEDEGEGGGISDEAMRECMGAVDEDALPTNNDIDNVATAEASRKAAVNKRLAQRMRGRGGRDED